MTHLRLSGLTLLVPLGFLGWGAGLAQADSPVEISVPPGFAATVFHEGVGRARHLVATDDGRVYVRLREAPRGRGIVALQDQDGNGKADVEARFGIGAGTGIAVSGDWLYYSTNDTVYRQKLGDELIPDREAERIAHGFPEQRQHASKALTVDGEGGLYVDVGAPSNACQENARTPGSPGLDPCPQLERQAGVWRFSADQRDQTQVEDGVHWATGTRHFVALEWNAVAGELYGVQHGRDQLSFLFPDLYSVEDSAELPGEVFLRLTEGYNNGWPYAYWDWRREAHVVAPEYGGNGHRTVEEGTYPAPLLAFPGHWAPNDLVFYDGDAFPEAYHGAAFIAFHGSWNRAPLPQRGYCVVAVPMTDGEPSGGYEIFADGFGGQPVLQSPRDARHRPMGLAVGPEGELYVADSVQGTIWQIRWVGDAGEAEEG
jgi:glucose/arabinose dehydrogenase